MTLSSANPAAGLLAKKGARFEELMKERVFNDCKEVGIFGKEGLDWFNV